MTIALYSVLVFLAGGITTFLYVVLQAIVGWSGGAHVERISLGIGPVVFTRLIKDTEWCLSGLPLGGYTKFYGQDLDFPEAQLLPDGSSHKPFQEISAPSRLLVFVIGPISSLLVGCAMMGLPVVFGTCQLTADGTGQQIAPVSVHSIGIVPDVSTVEGQCAFVHGTFFAFWTNPVTAIRSGEWGGPVSWIYTTAIVSAQDPTGWLTCTGLFIAVMGLMNFVPMPSLNGGHVVFLFFESIGLGASERVIQRSHMIGLLVVLCAYLVFVSLDLRWLF